MQTIKDVAAKMGVGSGATEERATERGAYGTAATGAGTYGTAGTAAGTEHTGGVAGGPAYGGREAGYVEGVETRTAEVPVVQQTTTTTTTAAQPVVGGVETTARGGEAAVCGQEFFTKVEDRPMVKEVVERIKEHRPVEKEFVVETRATGVEREVGGGQVEILGTTERIVEVTPPKAPCE